MATARDEISVTVTLEEKLYVNKALTMLAASLKRANTNEANPAIRELREKDIVRVLGAIAKF